MAVSKRSLDEALRARYMQVVEQFLEEQGEEVLRTGSNEIAIPCVNDAGNDEYLVIVFKVPTGERGGEPYNGHAMAEDFAMKQEAKAAKAKEQAAKKAAKIAKDEAVRKAKAEAKAKAKEN